VTTWSKTIPALLTTLVRGGSMYFAPSKSKIQLSRGRECLIIYEWNEMNNLATCAHVRDGNMFSFLQRIRTVESGEEVFSISSKKTAGVGRSRTKIKEMVLLVGFVASVITDF